TALRFQPALELFRPAQIEAVQERPRVERDGRRIVATLEGVFEGLHVARDDGRIEHELGRAENEIGLMEVTAQRVAGLLQKTARVLGVGVRPQVGDELVPGEAALARSGEEREERERLALLGRADASRVVDGYRQAAERLEVQHTRTFDPFDPRLTGVSPTRPKVASAAKNGERAQEPVAHRGSGSGQGGLYDVGTLLHTRCAVARRVVGRL